MDFEILYRLYFRDVYRYVRGLSRDEHLAEEIAHLPGGGDFAGALEDREEVLALHRILHTLPEPYKEVFGLRVFGELPFRAIGQVFGKTEGWARVTYYRAKSRILRQWEAERDESEL